MGKQQKRLTTKEKKKLAGKISEGGPYRKAAEKAWEKSGVFKKSGNTLHPARANKANAKDLYEPLREKLYETYGKDIDLATDKRIDKGVRKGLVTAFKEGNLNNRTVPPIGKDKNLKKLQDIILKTPTKELKKLLAKDYSEIGILNFSEYLPKSVSIWDTLGFIKSFKKLTKEGYTFKNGGMVRKRKKYLTGTAVTDYMEDPGTELMQNEMNIAQAQYEAESNPWHMGMKAISGMLMETGSSMVQQGGGFGQAFGDAGDSMKKGGGFGNKLWGKKSSTSSGRSTRALGGKVEKEEELSPWQKKGHWMNKGATKLEDFLDAEGLWTDKTVKYDWEGQPIHPEYKPGMKMFSSKNEINKDYDDWLKARKKSKSTKKQNKGMSFELGGAVDNIPVELENDEVFKTPEGETARVKGATHAGGGIDIDLPEGTMIYSEKLEVGGVSLSDREIKRQKRIKKLKDRLGKDPSDNLLKLSIERTEENNKREEASDIKLQEFASALDGLTAFAYGTGKSGVRKKYYNAGMVGRTPGYNPNAEEGEEDGDVNMPWTTGDIAGMIGTAYSTFAPIQNTRRNRAGDTPNINAFKDFGQDALKANADSQGYVAQQRDAAKKDLELSRTSALKRGRNSARSVNTLRALDVNTDVAMNKAVGDIYDHFSKQMMGILDKKSGLENMQDKFVMQGEQNRDLNDRKDRDNYYTQLGIDKSTIGTGIQKFGSDLNTHWENQAFLDVAAERGQYGEKWVRKDGKWVLVNADGTVKEEGNG